MSLQPLTNHDLRFCLRRAPQPVLQVLKDNPRRACVAGGFIRSVVSGEPVNDIDIFASSQEHALAMADALANSGSTINIPPKKVITTDNAYTVRGFRIDPQIIHRWTFNDVMDVIPSFDFTIARAVFFWCNRGNMWKGFCDESFYSDLAAHRLVYCSPRRNEDAGGSLLRVLKFYQRGYRIPLDSLARILSRTVQGVSQDDRGSLTEAHWSTEFLRLLQEVDPQVDPHHLAHLPSCDEDFPEHEH